MDVLVLGSGSAIPVPGGSNASYLVRTGEVRLLIDCGPCVLQQLAAASLDPGDVTHVFLTHRHGDHTLGYPMFILWWLLNREDAALPPTIATPTTWASLAVLLNHSFGELSRRIGTLPRRLLPDAEPSSFELVPGVTLRTWPLVHSTFAPATGLRVEAEGKVAAFTGDTGPCDALLPLARDADLLVHEASFSETLEPSYADGLFGHSTARAAGRRAAEAGAKRLALVHISPFYGGREAALVAEAAGTFGGEVSAPASGHVFRL